MAQQKLKLTVITKAKEERGEPSGKEIGMRKKYRKMVVFMLSIMLLLTAAVSPAVYAAQDTGFSDTVQETQEELVTESMESQVPEEETVAENAEDTEPEQDTVIAPEEDSFSDGADWTQEPEEEFISDIEEMEPEPEQETESENEPESGEPLMKKSAARNTVLLAANSDSSTWFATADELQDSYDTHALSEEPAKKIYFGQNGSGSKQEWWIVGKDKVGGLVLFAASPLATVKFSSNTSERDYNGQRVFSNHYGASDLINTLKELEMNTDYFSKAEQNLMMKTTVYTEDSKNSNQIYSTEGKLYAAYGLFNGAREYVTAGTNYDRLNMLNAGLRIDVRYCGGNTFWLRAPYPGGYNYEYGLVGASDRIQSAIVTNSASVMPVFRLDLSSVLFASAASAVSSNETLTTGDTFTLRYKSNNLGSAAISKGKACVTISNVFDNTYLVAQNANGAWARKVGDGDVIFASELDRSLTSFEDCEVWLEKTDSSSGLIYAAKAMDSAGYYVRVNAGQNMNLQSGSSTQQNVTGSINNITYEAEEGYCFPDDYNVEGTNGLSITVSDDNESITISGTPTTDTVLTLAGALEKSKPLAPEVTRASGSASTLTITSLTDTGTYGEARYSINNGATWQESNEFTNLKAGHAYTVWAKYLGKGAYIESEIGTAVISTDSAGYTISIPKTAQAGGGSVNIGVDTGQKFDLGHNGQVSVKVQAGGAVSTDGIVMLTRQRDSDSKTVTSAMFINGIRFRDITKNVATFTTKDDKAVSVTFGTPAETEIAAGEYSGMVTFEISYSEL